MGDRARPASMRGMTRASAIPVLRRAVDAGLSDGGSLATGSRSLGSLTRHGLTGGLLGAALLLAGCATPPDALDGSGATPDADPASAPVGAHGGSMNDASSGDGMAPEQGGQPTAGDLDFLVGAWRQERLGTVTSWEVWRRTDTGLVAEAWQASRGVVRQTERLELDLTLDGWVLTPVLFDEFEREARSDAFPLTAWGEGWVRFENPEHATPHTIAYRRTATGLEAWLVSEGGSGPAEKTVFRFVPMEE